MGCTYSRSLRTIYLTGKVDAEMAVMFNRHLAQLIAKGKETIRVVINSGGGACDAGFSIVDDIRSSPVQVHTHVSGDASSMAALILASGHKRSASRHSCVMVHQCSFRLNGTYNEVINGEFQIVKHVQETYLNIMAELTGRPPSLWSDMWKSSNVYLTPAQAMDLGMIDEVTKWLPIKEIR